MNNAVQRSVAAGLQEYTFLQEPARSVQGFSGNRADREKTYSALLNSALPSC